MKAYFDRSTVVGAVLFVLFILLLETHAVSRPMAFLWGPWLISLYLFVAAPSNFLARWRGVVPDRWSSVSLSLLGGAVWIRLISENGETRDRLKTFSNREIVS